MRTTVTLDDALLGQLKRKAAEPFEIITFGKGGSGPLVNVDKTSELIGLEDEERYGQNRGELSAAS